MPAPITAIDITNALKAPEADKPAISRSMIALGYLGGILIITGIAYFIHEIWSQIGSVPRVAILLVPGIIALGIALNLERKQAQQLIAMPLYVLSAALQTGALFTVIVEFFPSTGEWHLPVSAIMAAMLSQNVLLLKKTGRTVLVFLSLGYYTALLATLIDWPDIISRDLNQLITGASLLLLTLSLRNTKHHEVCGFWFLVSTAIIAEALFDILLDTQAHFLLLLLCSGGIYLGTWLCSKMVLFVNALALFAYIAWFSHKYFSDSLGWPLVMVLLGVILISMSVFILRISQKIPSTNS